MDKLARWWSEGAKLMDPRGLASEAARARFDTDAVGTSRPVERQRFIGWPRSTRQR
jgi:hypothetical protein